MSTTNVTFELSADVAKTLGPLIQVTQGYKDVEKAGKKSAKETAEAYEKMRKEGKATAAELKAAYMEAMKAAKRAGEDTGEAYKVMQKETEKILAPLRKQAKEYDAVGGAGKRAGDRVKEGFDGAGKTTGRLREDLRGVGGDMAKMALGAVSIGAGFAKAREMIVREMQLISQSAMQALSNIEKAFAAGKGEAATKGPGLMGSELLKNIKAAGLEMPTSMAVDLASGFKEDIPQERMMEYLKAIDVVAPAFSNEQLKQLRTLMESIGKVAPEMSAMDVSDVAIMSMQTGVPEMGASMKSLMKMRDAGVSPELALGLAITAKKGNQENEALDALLNYASKDPTLEATFDQSKYQQARKAGLSEDEAMSAASYTPEQTATMKAMQGKTLEERLIYLMDNREGLPLEMQSAVNTLVEEMKRSNMVERVRTEMGPGASATLGVVGSIEEDQMALRRRTDLRTKAYEERRIEANDSSEEAAARKILDTYLATARPGDEKFKLDNIASFNAAIAMGANPTEALYKAAPGALEGFVPAAAQASYEEGMARTEFKAPFLDYLGFKDENLPERVARRAVEEEYIQAAREASGFAPGMVTPATTAQGQADLATRLEGLTGALENMAGALTQIEKNTRANGRGVMVGQSAGAGGE